nr:uncharacterized protein LOC109118870 [Solanum lycopersicum]
MGTSVDQPEPEPGHVPPAIQWRLLAEYSCTPLIGIMYLAKIEAKDLYDVKVEILNIMEVLDLTRDSLGRAARALENPRTATGENSLDKLNTLLLDLEFRGFTSESFSQLKGKVPLRRGWD